MCNVGNIGCHYRRRKRNISYVERKISRKEYFPEQTKNKKLCREMTRENSLYKQQREEERKKLNTDTGEDNDKK